MCNPHMKESLIAMAKWEHRQSIITEDEAQHQIDLYENMTESALLQEYNEVFSAILE